MTDRLISHQFRFALASACHGLGGKRGILYYLRLNLGGV